MRIAFLGSDNFGLATLDALAASDRHELLGVVSQPDRPAGRGRKVTPTPVAAWARGRGLPLLCPPNVNRPDILAELAGWRADVGVVIAFGQKLGDALLNSLPHGCVNLHSSLLPKYRGAAPVAHAIIHGERETGVTVFRLVQRMDAGPIVCQRTVAIAPAETAGELRERLSRLGPEAIGGTLDAIAAGTAGFVQQDDREATLAPKLVRADGVIDWTVPAERIACRIRGVYPWPGAHARYVHRSGRCEDVVLVRAVAEPAGDPSDIRPGELTETLGVAAGEGVVRVLQIKPAGRNVMDFTAFVNGRNVQPGDRFEPTGPAGEKWNQSPHE